MTELNKAAEAALAFDEKKVKRDKEGKFSEKAMLRPGTGIGTTKKGSSKKGKPVMGSGGTRVDVKGERLRKNRERIQKAEKAERSKTLPDPSPTPISGKKAQVVDIEKALGVEVDKTEDEFGFKRSKGNAFERALELIRKLRKMMSDKATEALVKLQIKAESQVEGLKELEPKEYAEIPDHATHFLHYATEHAAEIQAIVENLIVTEADDDAVQAFDESKVKRDRVGRFADMPGIKGRLARLVRGSDDIQGTHNGYTYTVKPDSGGYRWEAKSPIRDNGQTSRSGTEPTRDKAESAAKRYIDADNKRHYEHYWGQRGGPPAGGVPNAPIHHGLRKPKLNFSQAIDRAKALFD